MTYLLLQHIQTLLTDELEQATLAKKGAASVWTVPPVHIGAVPPSSKDSEALPFVLVRAIGGQEKQEEHSIDVEIVCGIYTPDDIESGTNIILNILERCRRPLIEKRNGFGQFLLELPITWSVGNDEEHNQPHPFHLGVIKTKWITQSIEPIEEENLYGAGY